MKYQNLQKFGGKKEKIGLGYFKATGLIICILDAVNVIIVFVFYFFIPFQMHDTVTTNKTNKQTNKRKEKKRKEKKTKQNKTKHWINTGLFVLI